MTFKDILSGFWDSKVGKAWCWSFNVERRHQTDIGIPFDSGLSRKTLKYFENSFERDFWKNAKGSFKVERRQQTDIAITYDNGLSRKTLEYSENSFEYDILLRYLRIFTLESGAQSKAKGPKFKSTIF